MKIASLKDQFINVITYNHGRELWFSRPHQSFDETMEPLLNDLVKIAELYKGGASFELHGWDVEECAYGGEGIDHTIGYRIRDLQDEKGLSVKELAKKAGIDAEYLRNVEKGESLLSMWSLGQIARALGVHSSALLPF